MKQKQAVDLGTYSIGRLLFKLALPAIAAQIINVMYNVVDRMYIGHIPEIGPDALTGVGVTLPLITAISAFAALVSMGGAPRASIMMGREDNKTAEKILGNCFVLLMGISIILTLIISFWGREILMAFGASDKTIGYAWDYMKIYAIGTVFVQLALGLNAFINAQGFAKHGMLTVLIGAISNIILDPIFIYGFNMGVKGAALATIISQGISCIYVLGFLISKHSKLKLKLKSMVLNPRIFLPCLALGISPFIMQFTESVIFVCFNTSLFKYGGDLAVGAMTILISLMQFTFLPLYGLTQGAQPIISYNFGANNIDRVKDTFKLLLKSSMIYSTILWLVCMIVPQLLVSIFTNNQALKDFSVWATRIYMAGAVLLGAQVACQQTFIALGNAKISLFLALLRKVLLLIPLIYILPLIFSNKIMAVFLAEPIADIIAVATTCMMFYFSYKKLDSIKQPLPPIKGLED